jgi:hypothetical protein
MDLHTSYDLLRVTPPDLPALSFAAAKPAAVGAWLAELPKANLGETARRLYTALQELNRLQTPPANRLQLLELLQPEVQFACTQLERHLRNQVVILDARRQQIATLSQTLQQQLARAAKLTASEALRLPASEAGPLANRALLLALQGLYRLLCQYSLLYIPPPQGFWLELHQLYRVAARYRLERLQLSAGQGATQTIEQCYLSSLLLGCARGNQLRQQAIQLLGEALPAWSNRARLQDARLADSLFAFAPNADSPPRHTSLLQDEARPRLLGLAPQYLVADLREYLLLGREQRVHARLPVPHGISDELLQHLCTAWSAPAERAFNRVPGDGSLSACIGISALHYFAAGRRSFAEVLQLPDEEVSVCFQRRQREKDAWARAYDAARDDTLQHKEVRERIDFTPASKRDQLPADEREDYPRHQLRIVNQSPGGYCLNWDDSPPSQLQSGDLIGLQHPGEHGWNIALIRWIHQQRGAGLQLGIELLAPRARACGLRLQPSSGQPGQYLRGLLLNAIPALGRPALLIAPHLPFQQGQRILLNLDGELQRLLLTRRHALSDSFNQFEYHRLDTPAESERKPVTGLRIVSEEEEEGFDSLWESL